MKTKVLKYLLFVATFLVALLIIFRGRALLYLTVGFMDNPHFLSFEEWKQVVSWVVNPTH